MKVTLYKAQDPVDGQFILHVSKILQGKLRTSPIPIYLDNIKIGVVLGQELVPGDRLDVVIDTDIIELFTMYELVFWAEDFGIYRFEAVKKEVFDVTGLRVPDIRSSRLYTEIRTG